MNESKIFKIIEQITSRSLYVKQNTIKYKIQQITKNSEFSQKACCNQTVFQVSTLMIDYKLHKIYL